jgi:single-strand DNA-binding protein
MINKVTLIGNLGKDPEVRHLENGAAVARITVATNESYRDKDGQWQTQTEWHNVIAWRLLAERAERDLKKGSLVYVEGKLRSRQYKDKDGLDKTTTEVEATTIRGLDKRERTDGGGSVPLPSSPSGGYQGGSGFSSSGPSSPDPLDGGMDAGGNIDDLPF